METKYCTQCKKNERNESRKRCNTCIEKTRCIHNKEKTRCLDCGGGELCIHGKRNSRCLDCGGGEFCVHEKMKYNCIICKGTGTCEHGKQKSNCKFCDLPHYLINLQRSNIRRMLKQSSIGKSQSTIEYLGCTPNHFMDYLLLKMTPDMTMDNIHIDHIKPVSRFNLHDHDDFLDCSHYTNLQPLLAKDNMSKSNKWSEKDEIYWKENIRGLETTEIYLT